MISRFSAELVTAMITAVLGLITVFGAMEYGIGWSKSGPEPGTFPFYVGLLVTIASLGIVLQTLLRRASLNQAWLTAQQLRSVGLFVGPMVAFLIVSLWLGLYVGMALYIFGSMAFQGGYRLHTAALVGGGMAVFMYLVLEVAFKTPLLKGPLENALGL
jgi:hypothetical protein